MKIANFEYKCRRCGKIDDSLSTSETNARSLIHGVIIHGKDSLPNDVNTVRMVDTHYCQDGGVGVTDLIGYSVKEY